MGCGNDVITEHSARCASSNAIERADVLRNIRQAFLYSFGSRQLIIAKMNGRALKTKAQDSDEQLNSAAAPCT